MPETPNPKPPPLPTDLEPLPLDVFIPENEGRRFSILIDRAVDKLFGSTNKEPVRGDKA